MSTATGRNLVDTNSIGYFPATTETAMIIFLPVRNGGDYLRLAISSIVAQTSDDWRLVVLENGSSDDTVATVVSFRDPRIVCLSAATPLGIVENWQRATAWLNERDPTTLAQGGGEETVAGEALMTFIGHDDYLMPEFVERIAALATTAPDATLYQTGFDLVDGDGKLIRPCRPIPETETWQDFAAALCWDLRDSYGTGYAFRVRDYLAVGGIPDFPLLLSSDHLLFVRLARRGYKRSDTRTGCAYRLHGGSTSGRMTRTKLNAHVEGLAGYVAALVGMEFTARQEGRDALACLLGRELWTLRLPAVPRALTAENKARCAHLEAMFAQVARGVDLSTWAEPVSGPFARLSAGARRFARSAALYLHSRRP